MNQAEQSGIAGGQDAGKGAEARAGQRRSEAGAYLDALFSTRHSYDPVLARLGADVLLRNPDARDALMLPRNVVPLIWRLPDAASRTGREAGGKAGGNAGGEAEATPHEMPAWLLLPDWPEFLEGEVAFSLSEWPELPEKLAATAPLIGAAAETALSGNRSPARLKRPQAAQLGLYASALAIHGRYKRALALLEWLDKARPGQPETAKRMANVCWLVGNKKAALQWQAAAVGAAPENALLHLSLALMSARSERASEAALHLTEAERLWPGLSLTAQIRRKAEAAGKA